MQENKECAPGLSHLIRKAVGVFRHSPTEHSAALSGTSFPIVQDTCVRCR